MRAGDNKRRGGGKEGPSGEAAGGGSPKAGRSEGEGSPKTRTGTSGTEGDQSHWAGAAGTEGRNTEVVHWSGTSRGNVRTKRQERACGLVGPEHSGKAGTGLVPPEMRYVQKRPKGRAECNSRRGSARQRKNGGKRDDERAGVSGTEQGVRRRVSFGRPSIRLGSRRCIQHRKKDGDSGRTPPHWGIQCGGEGRTGGTSGASGVARQGGREKRPHDRGQAAVDPGQVESGGAARWWPGGHSRGRLKSQGRQAQGTKEELRRGPGGRKPAS